MIEAPVHTDTAKSEGGKRQRVMVVDDDDGVRVFIVECLETLGYEVFPAVGGEEALLMLSDVRPQVIIVDYAMPGMSGVDLLKQVRRRDCKLPVILATGYADMAAVEEVMTLDSVLRKPFRIDELDRAVREALLEPQAA